MKFNNNSEEFILRYNSKEYEIPAGSFDINDDDLSHFLIGKAIEWNKDVTCIDDSSQKTIVTKVKAIEKIEEKGVDEKAKEVEAKKEVKKEEKKEEEKEVKNTEKKEESAKKLNNLEKSL